MISAIIAAAGKNRRMRADMQSKGLEIKPKLLLDYGDKPILIRTIENVQKAGVNKIFVVLGHYRDEILAVLRKFHTNVNIIENPHNEIQLSETLLNGVKNIENELCLCLAGDQPTLSPLTIRNLIKEALKASDPENFVSILARGREGYLSSTKGLGMPFVCHSHLLRKYLPGKEDNLNPILNEMLKDGVIFYGTPPLNELELVNINRWQDYLQILRKNKPY